MRLRAYQREDKAAIEAALRKHRKALLVRPTGTGKTVTACAVINDIPGPTLVLVHRQELLGQWHLLLTEATVWNAKAKDASGSVVLAMRQTLARSLERFPAERFTTVVVDECHVAADSNSTARLLSALSSARILGLSAIPYGGAPRTHRAVSAAFGVQIGEERSTADFIEQGVLAPLWKANHYIQCSIEPIEKLKSLNAETSEKKIADRLLRANAPSKVAEAWAKHAKGRKGIIYTAGKENARSTVRALVRLGVKARVLDDDCPADERARILQVFRAGKIHAVVNVTILTEGFDDPTVDCIMYARPCHSKGLAVQILGRGLRKSQGKRDCLVIDACGVLYRHHDILAPRRDKAPELIEVDGATGHRIGPSRDRIRGLLKTEERVLRAPACVVCGYAFTKPARADRRYCSQRCNYLVRSRLRGVGPLADRSPKISSALLERSFVQLEAFRSTTGRWPVRNEPGGYLLIKARLGECPEFISRIASLGPDWQGLLESRGCKRCGVSFDPNRRWTVFCSEQCQRLDAGARERARKREAKNLPESKESSCRFCLATFNSAFHSKRIYCSRSCGQKAYLKRKLTGGSHGSRSHRP